MPDPTLPPELANNLWLLSRAAERHTQDAIAATTKVDELVHQALGRSDDVDAIAADTFLDRALIDHIRAGGGSLGYFTQPGVDRI